MSRTVTIRDVAAAAGVSIATVSRVLSGGEGVSPALAARVESTAKHLGYRANRVAQALRRQSTRTVGLLVPDITNPFFPAIVQAIEQTLRKAGFSLLLCDACNDVATEAELIGNLLAHQVDGLLISVCDRIASRHALGLAANRLPVVQIDRCALEGMPYVGVDQADAIAQLAGHLRADGYRRFAYITPATGISTADERLTEFLRQIEPLDPGVRSRVYAGDFSLEWGHEAARRILTRDPRPDVIVCANDLIAVGALRALREAHVRIPHEVAVTGFDDTVLAAASHPQLTTVRQPLGELGAEAVSMLCAAIAQPGEPLRPAVLRGRLIVRGSSQRRSEGSGRPAAQAIQ